REQIDRAHEEVREHVADQEPPGEGGKQPLDQRLERSEGDDDEAPENDEVVLAPQRAHERGPALGGKARLLDDLLLSEEIVENGVDPLEGVIRPVVRAAREEHPGEAPEGPREEAESGSQYDRE